MGKESRLTAKSKYFVKNVAGVFLEIYVENGYTIPEISIKSLAIRSDTKPLPNLKRYFIASLN